MNLSQFGHKFGGTTGIVELMDDLGTALNENPEMIFMGGGNPGEVPQVEAVFKQRLQSIVDNPALLRRLTGVYQ